LRQSKILAVSILFIALIAPGTGQLTAEDWLNEGQRLVDLGLYAQALQAYDNGIALSPQWTDLYYHKGTAYTKLGMVDEAVEAFDKVNEINPSDGVVAYYWIGRTLEGAGRYEEALEAYDNSVSSFDTYGEWWPGQKSICAQAWYHKGLVLDTLGRSEEAQIAYGNAIQLDPGITRPNAPGAGNTTSIGGLGGTGTSGVGGGGIGSGTGGSMTGSYVAMYCLLRKPFYPQQENCYEFYLASTTASAARATVSGGACYVTDIGAREGWEPDELYPGPFSTFEEGDAAMTMVSPYFDDAYGCHETSIDATPGGMDLAGSNPTRGFEDSDQVDVWIPFSFDFAPPANVSKAKIVMVVKPIGQLIGTDQLVLKGASGEVQVVYDQFTSLEADQWNTVEVDISGNSDVMDAIRSGHLEGMIQDDTAVQSVKLKI